MMRRMLAGLAFATLAVGMAVAQAPSTAPPQPGQFLNRMAVLLDLTDSQKLQLQQIFEEQHAQMKALHEQAQASGQKPDFQQMRATHEQMRQQLLSKAQAILSADQFKKFQLLTERPHGGHRGPPPGAGSTPPPG